MVIVLNLLVPNLYRQSIDFQGIYYDLYTIYPFNFVCRLLKCFLEINHLIYHLVSCSICSLDISFSIATNTISDNVVLCLKAYSFSLILSLVDTLKTILSFFLSISIPLYSVTLGIHYIDLGIHISMLRYTYYFYTISIFPLHIVSVLLSCLLRYTFCYPCNTSLYLTLPSSSHQ